jgi:hypothetical protein
VKRLACVLAAAVLVLAKDADAACPQGAVGEAIRSCRLHVVTGPVLAPSRVLGLAGAYQGIAEGLPGFAANAAAPAVRTPWSWQWFDYDLDASISIPSAFRKLDDLEFDGIKEDFNYSRFVFITLGANAQFGPWGVGAITDLQRFDLTERDHVEQYRALLSRTKVLAGRSLFGGDLVVGGGLRTIGFDVSGTTAAGETKSLVSAFGVAPELGFLYRPAEYAFRIGATYRMAVSAGREAGVEKVDRWWIPASVSLPWELDVGVAMQGGNRPLNVHWSNPHDDAERFADEIHRARERRAAERAAILAGTEPGLRTTRAAELERDEATIRSVEERERKAFPKTYARIAREKYARLSREHLLFTLGLLIIGTTTDGISLESFFTQQITRAGAVTTYSPRAGVETEIVPNVLRPRVGTYIEPSRFTLEPDWKAFRQHITAGFDLNLFRWRVFGLYDEGTAWRLTMAIDVSHNYWNYGLSVGIWR